MFKLFSAALVSLSVLAVITPASAEIVRGTASSGSTTNGRQVTAIQGTSWSNSSSLKKVEDHSIFLQGNPCGCGGDTAMEESRINLVEQSIGGSSRTDQTMVDLQINSWTRVDVDYTGTGQFMPNIFGN